MPLWQSYTPAPQLTDVTYTTPDGVVHYGQVPYGGGTFTGIAMTPVILRWNFKNSKAGCRHSCREPVA